MSKNLPLLVELEQGTYYWCSCGKSANEPFCDGSHEGTGKMPMAFTVAEKKKMGICQCQRTKKPPFCDGTHARVE